MWICRWDKIEYCEQCNFSSFVCRSYNIWCTWHKNDKDFNISLNKKELIWLAIKTVISFPVVINTNIVTSIFLIICMSYMQIAAITDKKTQLVTFGYIYILVPLSVICESIILKHFSCFYFWLYCCWQQQYIL